MSLMLFALGMFIGYNMKSSKIVKVVAREDDLLDRLYESYTRGKAKTMRHKKSGTIYAIELIPLPDARYVNAD